MVDFTLERSATIRANLINHVAESRLPRRRRALWAAGFVLAGALAGAGASAGALAATEIFTGGVTDGEPTPDYVLTVQSTGAQASPKDPYGTLELLGLRATAMARYEDFRGLGIWSGQSRDGMNCILVAHPGQGLREGIGDEGCSPMGVDAIADLVDPASPQYATGPVYTGLPPGSLIRFVLAGDHVNVYMYPNPADAAGIEQRRNEPGQVDWVKTFMTATLLLGTAATVAAIVAYRRRKSARAEAENEAATDS